MKCCKACKQHKNIEDFYVNNKTTGNRNLTCKICEQEKRKKRRLEFPHEWRIVENNRKRKWGKKYPERLHATLLKRCYGLTKEDYNKMLSKQNSVCAICKKQEVKINKETGEPKRLAVDHCHNTGKIRGLLCFHCNSSLGKMKDSVEILQNAIEYLKRE